MKTNYAMLSMIFGILSIIPFFRSGVAAIFAIVAIVFYSLTHQKKSPMAIAGLALGIIGLIWFFSAFFR